ncbi:MAG: DoxX family protein [Alphaproteobacteria bacterium]|nr:DoxX family protein [Alphaproteobacteria bacterium]
MADIMNEPKPILPFTKSITTALMPYTDPLFRIITGALLMPHGYGKLFTPGALEGTGQFFESVGFTPGYELALLVGCVEFFGGLLLVLGLLTRPAAVAVAIFMGQAVLFHMANGFMWTNGGYEYPLFWFVAALILAVRGGGYLSVDRLIGREF